MERIAVFLLLVLGLSSTALGDRNDTDHGEECRLELKPNIKLPGIKCSARPYHYCNQITCSARFSHEEFKMSMEIGQWGDPVNAYVTFSVPELGFDWSHSFKDGDKLEIPAFPLEIEGFTTADVFLQVSLKKQNGTIDFKVDLEASWTELTHKTYNITIIEGKIPEPPPPEIAICGIGPLYKGFKALPTFAKVMICSSVVAFLFLLVLACVFFCKRKRNATGDELKVKPPSYDEATSTQTKVPMQPLVNEI